MKRLAQLAGWVVLATSLLLAGCASTRKIDSEVRSFAGAADAPGEPTFRFDRLPSQQPATALQERLEALATDALARKGLVRNDASARYSVVLQVQAEQYTPLLTHPAWPGRLRSGPHGRLWHPWPWLEMESTEYRHAVGILIRNVASGQLVYESRAVHDGPWGDTLNLLPAILEAALHDYPQASPTPHTVVVDLPPNPPKNR